mgnify:FL=1
MTAPPKTKILYRNKRSRPVSSKKKTTLAALWLPYQTLYSISVFDDMFRIGCLDPGNPLQKFPIRHIRRIEYRSGYMAIVLPACTLLLHTRHNDIRIILHPMNYRKTAFDKFFIFMHLFFNRIFIARNKNHKF